MKQIVIALTVMLLTACVAQQRPDATNAVKDFIEVSELEETESARTRDQYSYTVLSEEFIVVRSRHDHYLVQFTRKCRELDDPRPTPDIRHERNKIRARFDTIRGCHIDKIYPIDKVQAEELESLGKAPGEESQ